MRYLLIVASLMLLMSGVAIAQPQPSTPDIPELREMHHYIHPMWHKGYPQKDIPLLQSLYPDLSSQFEKLQQAEFPEEWPERKMAWQQGLTKMQQTLKNYKNAIDNNDAEALLTAARALHDNFESLMQIVNPPIPEIDDFHKTLYHVYHDFLPNKNWEGIWQSIDEFNQKLANLEKVTLPKWMADQEEQFIKARKNLRQAVEDLTKLKGSTDQKELEKAVERVHQAYVELAGSCE